MMKPHEYVILEVARERERQMAVEGWTPEHDDVEHPGCQLAIAAACYAAPVEMDMAGYTPFGRDSDDSTAKHPMRRRLVIAAALLVAEIERLDRKGEPPTSLPDDVRYSMEHDNFYHAETNKGMGIAFYRNHRHLIPGMKNTRPLD